MNLDTNSAIIGYKATGDGPQKVIVMHDWHGDHTLYDPILPYLDGKIFHYIFADLPGYGLSCDYTVPINIRKIASTVIALADYLDWPRFHIVGHSLSAMIAQYVALLAADRVTSLTAICPLPASGSLASDAALEFFASTANDDDAFRRLIGFLSGQLSDGWMDAKRTRSRISSTPEVKMQYFLIFFGQIFPVSFPDRIPKSILSLGIMIQDWTRPPFPLYSVTGLAIQVWM